VKKKKKKPQKSRNNTATENCTMEIDKKSESEVEKMEVDTSA